MFLEVFSPAQILLIMQTSAICYSVFSFSNFSIFLYSGIFKNLFLSVPSGLSCVLFCCLSCPFFYSFLLFFLFPIIFSPSLFRYLRYLLYFLISLCFRFKFAILSFLFFYYSTQGNL